MRWILVPVGPDQTVLTLVCDDGTQWSVPVDEANTDYQRYLAWLAEGNTPETYAL